MAEVWHLTTAWVPFPNELNYLEAVLEIQIIQNNFVKAPHAAETYINIKGVSKTRGRGRGLLSWDILMSFFLSFNPHTRLMWQIRIWVERKKKIHKKYPKKETPTPHFTDTPFILPICKVCFETNYVLSASCYGNILCSRLVWGFYDTPVLGTNLKKRHAWLRCWRLILIGFLTCKYLRHVYYNE